MKKLTLIFATILLSKVLLGQTLGNSGYQSQFSASNVDVSRFSNSNTIDYVSDIASYTSNKNIFISVKGLINVKADSYTAIFNVTQVGKTTEEVNRLLDDRINKAIENIKSKDGVEIYIDMISFVPKYEYEVEKKIFSKNTYNEIPIGFELQKNIHIKYTDSNILDEIVSDLSNVEIYDLVRVDYFSNNIENVKKELMNKAKTILKERMKNYEELLNESLDSVVKQLDDEYKIVLPIEMYKGYKAYSSSSLSLKKSADVNQADKSITLCYKPVIDKKFDFVINPGILEPVIQVMYEIKLILNREKEEEMEEVEKEYILVTPNGDLKTIK